MASLTTVMSPTATPTINSTVEPTYPAAFLGMWLFVLVYIFLMAVATVFVNGLTLYAIYKDPCNCFRNPLTIFVTGVVSADFLTGLIGEPLIAAGIAHNWNTDQKVVAAFLFVIGGVVACVTITVSFLILLALAISQLLAIGWYHSRYKRSVSVFRAKLGIALIWMFTFIFSVGLVFVHIFLVFGLLIFEVSLTTIALVVLYVVSFFVFRSRVARDDTDVVSKEFLRGNFLLVMVNIFTVWPYIIATYTIPSYSRSDNWVSLEIVRLVTMILFTTKFLLDPLILVWRIPKYRKSMKIVYASCLARCGCAGDETAEEGKAVYAETRQEDVDDKSQEENVNVEV